MAKLWTTKKDGSPRRPLGTVRYLTIHCTATPEGLDVSADQVSAMDMARADLGYQTAYHYVVELDGTVHNTIPEDLLGAHCRPNSGNIGISYVGGIDRVTKKPKDTRTPAQKAALKAFVADFKKRYPKAAVLGHRDWSPDLNKDGKIAPNEWIKACPCFDVKAWMAAEGV